MASEFELMITLAGFERKQYQVDCVAWAAVRETDEIPEEGVRGGLIADEMGLGKTVMLVGLIVTNLHIYKHTLIVMPKALLNQWEEEILKLTGSEVLVYHGMRKEEITQEKLEFAPIVLTTYGHVLRHQMLKDVSWDRVIFDEGHHLRNNTRIFKESVKVKSRSKWVVTGTPIQNKLDDLFNLLKVVGYSEIKSDERDRLSRILKTAVIARTKKDVGIKLESPIVCTSEVEWKSEYEKEVARRFHGYSEADDLEMPNNPLAKLVRRRQSCIAPILTDKRNSNTYSSKLEAVAKSVVDRISTGGSKLVFCTFRKEIDILENTLRRNLPENHNNVQVFDGRTKPSKRKDILKEHYDVLLLQIQSACEGLNLQHYSEVYFVTPHWNPAVEDQAIARCHRIGQKKQVKVYRYYMEDLDVEEDKRSAKVEIIEKNIIERQKEKRKMYSFME